MAYSKAPLFDQVLFNQSFWSKALSHPARIIILTHLLENGVTAFYILAKKLPLAKTTVSQHLRFLRQAGLIESFEKYPHSYYKINQKVCRELAQRIHSLHSSFMSGETDPVEPFGKQ
jgi:DNA-binding transcriptional ArsR family regulator